MLGGAPQAARVWGARWGTWSAASLPSLKSRGASQGFMSLHQPLTWSFWAALTA